MGESVRRCGLKAQCMSIAQGNALGIEKVTLTPCKGKSLTICVRLSEYGDTYALTGRQHSLNAHPGRCPGLGTYTGLSARPNSLPTQIVIEPKF